MQPDEAMEEAGLVDGHLELADLIRTAGWIILDLHAGLFHGLAHFPIGRVDVGRIGVVVLHPVLILVLIPLTGPEFLEARLQGYRRSGFGALDVPDHEQRGQRSETGQYGGDRDLPFPELWHLNLHS